MAPSLIYYKLVVVDASRAYSLVAYGHGDRLLALLYDDHHYDALTSLKGFSRALLPLSRVSQGVRSPGTTSMPAEQRGTLQQLFANGLRRTQSRLSILPITRRVVPAL